MPRFQNRINRSVRQAVACFEALDSRTLLSTTLSGVPTLSETVETGGVYNTNSYLAVSGSQQNSFFQGFGFLEYGPSSTISPKTFKVSDINNVTLSLYNTATSGGFGGHAGNFDVYFAPDNTTAANSIRFQASDVQGLGGQLGTSAATDLGTQAFTNSTVGYTDYTFANLPTAVKQGIVNDLNTGTAVRFAVVPDSTDFAADWEGNFSKNQPKLALNVEQNTATSVEQFGFSSGIYSVSEDGGTATVTVNRSGTSIADAATVNYATSDGSALAGTNYTATSGTLGFAAGQANATFTVPISAVQNQGGDKALRVTLSSPNAGTTGFSHMLGAQSTAVLTIGDRVNTPSNTETLTQTSADSTTIETSGPYASTYFNVTGTSGRYPAFGALDFNSTNAAGTALKFTPAKTISAINNIHLNVTQGYPVQGTSGPMDVYLVSDSASDIDADGNSPLAFDTNSGPEGLGNQLGTKTLLGKVNFDATIPADVYTSIQLLDYTQAGENTLIGDLNAGTKFRVVLVPENTTVAASLEGQYSYNGVSEAPQLSFNVSEAAAAQVIRGDVNNDGAVDAGDINAFRAALLAGDAQTFATQFPNYNYAAADTNGDGNVDAGDINSLRALVLSGGAPAAVAAPAVIAPAASPFSNTAISTSRIADQVL